MQNLEDFIAQNRTLFDDEELPQGHEERFFTKWAKAASRKRQQRLRLRLISMAAAAAVVLLAGWGVREFAFRRPAVEARMLRQYRHQIAALRHQLDDYETALAPVDWEQIEDTVELLTEDPDAFSEQFPPDIPSAQRREALKEYYAQNLAGMKQMVALVAASASSHYH